MCLGLEYNIKDEFPYRVYHKYADGSEYNLPVRSEEIAKIFMEKIMSDSRRSGIRIIEIEIRKSLLINDLIHRPSIYFSVKN